MDSDNQRVSGTGHVVRDKGREHSVPADCVPVRLVPLDSMADVHPELLRTSIIKCDVEGFELMVFRGALKTINASRPVVIAEVGGAEQHGYDNDELFSFFDRLGYESYVAVSPSVLRPSRKAGPIPEGQRPNRIFIPQEFDLESHELDVVRK